MTRNVPEVENNLAASRQKRGLSAPDLAKLVGVSRQTIYAMEAGSYTPNTALALKLARALEARVEDLFALPDEAAGPDAHIQKATLLPGSAIPAAGQPVQLCVVNQRLIASASSAVHYYFPASDAIATGKAAAPGISNVQAFRAEAEFRNRILIAGCDPGMSVLARHVQSTGIELVLAHRNSSQALSLLKQGCIHIAGTHLRDPVSGEANIPEIGRIFTKKSVAVISFAVWEEGIVTAKRNPKGIRGIQDFARAEVRIANREQGAGSRALLDAELKRLGIGVRSVRGYHRIGQGHLQAAWLVQSGEVDCCIAPRAAARVFGLGFIPLVSQRYDLAIRKQHLEVPAVQTVFETLSRSNFRRELENLGGYDTTASGMQLM